MAQPLGSGPVHVFVAYGVDVQSDDALYYGTTREGPDVSSNISLYPIMNDYTGPAISLEDGYAGREDQISLVMTRLNLAVYQGMDHFLDPAFAFNPAGTDSLSDIGTMILSENVALTIWLVRQGALRTVNVGTGMKQGRKYVACEIMSQKPIEGNKENIYVTTLKAKQKPDVANNKLILYREEANEFSGLLARID